jgi:class 3 adenylate cyclase
MSWSYEKSVTRGEAALDLVGEVTVTPIVRETDFDTIGLANPRTVTGAHLYVDVTNYTDLLGDDFDAGADTDLLRQLHIFAREGSRIVEPGFGAVKIHYQGARLHAVSYRPVGDDKEIVAATVLLAAAVRRYTEQFNDALGLSGTRRWATAGAIDFGDAVATRNGAKGDRELMFLGSPANHAAKLLDTGWRLSAAAVALLPADIAAYVTVDETGVGVIEDIDDDTLAGLTRDRGLSWNAADIAEQLAAAADSFPVGCATITSVTNTIDKDTLGLSNSKETDAVSLFADVDGFTAYIDEAAEQDTLDAAVQAFHVIRKELRDIVKCDYDGIRIQYHGDRIQSLHYLPIGDPAEMALTAVRAAAAMTSAAATSLPDVLGAERVRPLAIGLDTGLTLVSKLGEHGDRDVVALAPTTAGAARIQTSLEGGQIGVSARLYDLLPDWLQPAFRLDPARDCYVADDLDHDSLKLLETGTDHGTAKALGTAVAIGTAAVGVAAAVAAARRVRAAEPPMRPWHPGM